MVAQKAFKYRFFPPQRQATRLAITFGCAQCLFNQTSEYQTIAWRQEKESAVHHLTAAKSTEWKKEPEKAFFYKASSIALQQSLSKVELGVDIAPDKAVAFGGGRMSI